MRSKPHEVISNLYSVCFVEIKVLMYVWKKYSYKIFILITYLTNNVYTFKFDFYNHPNL